jgi:hypothetical protein
MAIETLQLKIAAEKAIQTARKAITPLKDFAVSFNAGESIKGSAIRVPVFNVGDAAEFDADSNNYEGTTQGVTGVDVNLNNHFVKSVFYTDRDFIECDVKFFEGAGDAIATVLGKGAVAQAMGLINETNVPNKSVMTIANYSDKKNIANLYKVADENDLTPGECVLLLTPAAFAALLAQLDANVYGGDEAIKNGYVPGLYGFKSVIMCNSLGTDMTGAIVHTEAIGVAGRYLAPDASAYSETGMVTDEHTGLTIGFRRFANPATGKRYIAGEMLYGAQLIQPTKIVRLTLS